MVDFFSSSCIFYALVFLGIFLLFYFSRVLRTLLIAVWLYGPQMHCNDDGGNNLQGQ